MNQLAANSVRRDARRKYFKELLRRHKSRCHWCNRLVVRVKYLNEGKLFFLEFKNHIKIFINGKFEVVRVATIDHVLELALNGSNDIDNLVLACSVCNLERAKKFDRPKLTKGEIVVQ